VIRKIVLGLGNLLQRDEGFGIHTLFALKQRYPSIEDVEFIDGGVLGLKLLPLVEEASHLLVLDSVDAGLSPGSIIELVGDQIPLYGNSKLSEHQIGFQEVLGLARLRGRFPEKIHLIGVQPKEIWAGIGLIDEVQNALERVVVRASEIMRLEWGISL
jgi:hydrogenase maturation protease